MEEQKKSGIRDMANSNSTDPVRTIYTEKIAVDKATYKDAGIRDLAKD